MEKLEKIEFLTPDQCNLGDEWENYYVELKKIRKGDVFYECENGLNYKLEAVEDARQENDGWTCVVKDKKGEIYEVYVSGGTRYFGPNLFWTPQHLTVNELNNSIYIID
jgi:hypothetical protein